MKIKRLKDLSKKEYQKIMKRSFRANDKIFPKVGKIMEEIKKNGDLAIYDRYQKRYGKKNYQSIKVTSGEIKNAYQKVNKKSIKALKQMIKNIYLVHQAQLSSKKDKIVRPEKGIKVWREWRAIEKIGLYIPGGYANYPSSVLMSGIPAIVAGCRKIIICTPASKNGKIPASTIVAADMIGIKEIFKVAGASAIGALAYGTKSIPAVYKIFGAGGAYVTAAKMLISNNVAIDMPAGPSEVFVIADENAKPFFIAADLLADGEHGQDCACVLLTTSKKIATETIKELGKQLKNLATSERCKTSLQKFGLIALADTLEEAIDFCNEYAPEHLTIATKKPERIVEKIKNAGSIFLGNYTSKSSGDYATGANHVLPTGGMAKMYPPLGVDAYGKWMQVQKCTKNGLAQIRKTIENLSDIEELPAHKKATSIRFK